MYDELIKRIRQVAEEVCEDYDVDPYNAEQRCLAILQAADAIEELNKPRWIPVTERLPKMIDGENISKEVYVTDGTGIAKACIMCDYDGVTSWTYTGIGEITHWCEQIPLPQPPKEK